MKLTINGLCVNPVLGSVRLEKHCKDAAATLTATIWTAAADTYFLHLSLAVGDVVRLTDENGVEQFIGSIHSLKRTPEQVELLAFDRGIYLARNELRGVFAGSGEDICRSVAGRLGISVGTLEADSAYKVLVAVAGESAFSLLQQAAGKDREVSVEGETLVVRKARPVTFLLPTEHIREVSASADIRSMVNRCTVVDRKGRVLATAQDDGDMAAYGAFQMILGRTGEEPAAQAKNALKGRAKAAEVVLAGNMGYLCGAYVRGEHPQWGLSGLYRIAAVTHCWEKGQFTTELTLEGVEQEERRV